jgi:hypothetical protein
MYVSEVADPEGNLLARFARGSRIRKMLVKLGSTFDDENNPQCRVTFSEELLQVVRHAKDTNLEHL